MNVGDLLDQVAHGADDDAGTYRTAALRWLNLCRSEAYNVANWRTAIESDAKLTTSAAQTDGLYELDDHEHVVSQNMWDETNNDTIFFASYQDLQSVDDDKSITGPPKWWCDAGIENSTSGDRLLYLWPIPDGTYTIRFTGLRKYKDFVDSEEALTVDPIFGDLGPWAGAFAAGMRYYQDLDNNELPQQILIQERRWQKQLGARKKRNGVLPNVKMMLANIRQQQRPHTGRFSPAHFNNQ